MVPVAVLPAFQVAVQPLLMYNTTGTVLMVNSSASAVSTAAPAVDPLADITSAAPVPPAAPIAATATADGDTCLAHDEGQGVPPSPLRALVLPANLERRRAQTLEVQFDDHKAWRIWWAVETRKLKSTDRVAVSPGFELTLNA